jgi:hypothetical protein
MNRAFTSKVQVPAPRGLGLGRDLQLTVLSGDIRQRMFALNAVDREDQELVVTVAGGKRRGCDVRHSPRSDNAPATARLHQSFVPRAKPSRRTRSISSAGTKMRFPNRTVLSCPFSIARRPES